MLLLPLVTKILGIKDEKAENDNESAIGSNRGEVELARPQHLEVMLRDGTSNLGRAEPESGVCVENYVCDGEKDGQNENN